MEVVKAVLGRLLQWLRDDHRRTVAELLNDPTARLRKGIGLVGCVSNIPLAVLFGGNLYLTLIVKINSAPMSAIACRFAGLGTTFAAVIVGIALQIVKPRGLSWLLVLVTILATAASMSLAAIAADLAP